MSKKDPTGNYHDTSFAVSELMKFYHILLCLYIHTFISIILHQNGSKICNVNRHTIWSCKVWVFKFKTRCWKVHVFNQMTFILPLSTYSVNFHVNADLQKVQCIQLTVNAVATVLWSAKVHLEVKYNHTNTGTFTWSFALSIFVPIAFNPLNSRSVNWLH